MIPFFRKIRKKMADDNKPLKYMRYAVGEIVLVVIGILIALQINNWNEERKDRVESIKILKKLEAEFETNKTELNGSIHYHEQQYKATVKIEELFNPNHTIPTDTIKNLIKQAFTDWKFEPRLSITKSAMDSGKISLINNDSLTDNLNTWMYAIKKYNEIYAAINKDKEELWDDIIKKYPIKNFDPTTLGESNFKGDTDGIFSNLKNENIIRSLRHQEEFILSWCGALQEDHNDILRFIRNELSENSQ